MAEVRQRGDEGREAERLEGSWLKGASKDAVNVRRLRREIAEIEKRIAEIAPPSEPKSKRNFAIIP